MHTYLPTYLPIYLPPTYLPTYVRTAYDHFYHSFPHDILPVSVKSPVPRLHLGQVALSEETGRQEEPMSGEMGTSMAGASWFGFHSHGGTPNT